MNALKPSIYAPKFILSDCIHGYVVCIGSLVLKKLDNTSEEKIAAIKREKTAM